ncbi:MAG: GNAT family N-acetyltransferase [candidate division Zixibacteria bacterium]|nr:GNAT family N-acetyltransferase [candidate division Zixibacteria bacterium]
MLKWVDFKPEKPTLKHWIVGWFNYYIKFRLKLRLWSDSYSLIMKLKVDEMTAEDEEDKVGKRIWRMVLKNNTDAYHASKLTDETAGKFFDAFFPWKRKQLENYYKNGSECYQWKIYDQIVCCTWTSHGRIDPEVQKEMGIELPIGKKDYWGLDIIVHPDYRGKAFEFLLFNVTHRHLKKQGVDNLWAAVYLGDRGSVKMHHRVGFRPMHLLHQRFRFGFKQSNLYSFEKDGAAETHKAAEKLGVDLEFLFNNQQSQEITKEK